MSNTVKLSSKLAADEECNGLDHLADELIENPHQVVCCITWVTVKSVTLDAETGDSVPTVQIKRVEPIAAVNKVPSEVQQLAAQLYESRLGKGRTLPFDVVETVEGGYSIADEDQGEPEYA